MALDKIHMYSASKLETASLEPIHRSVSSLEDPFGFVEKVQRPDVTIEQKLTNRQNETYEIVPVGRVVMKPIYIQGETIHLENGSIVLEYFASWDTAFRSLAIRYEMLRILGAVKVYKDILDDNWKKVFEKHMSYMEYPRPLQIENLIDKIHIYKELRGEVTKVATFECRYPRCKFEVDFVEVISQNTSIIVRVNRGDHVHGEVSKQEIYRKGLLYNQKLLVADGIKTGQILKGDTQGTVAKNKLDMYAPLYKSKFSQISQYVCLVFKQLPDQVSNRLTQTQMQDLVQTVRDTYVGPEGDELIAAITRHEDSILLADRQLGACTTFFLSTDVVLEYLLYAKIWYVDFMASGNHNYHYGILTVLDGNRKIFPCSILISPKENLYFLRCLLTETLQKLVERFPGADLAFTGIMLDGLQGAKDSLNGLLKAIRRLLPNFDLGRFTCFEHAERCVGRKLTSLAFTNTAAKELVLDFVSILSLAPSHFVLMSLVVSFANLFMGISKYGFTTDKVYAFFRYFIDEYVFNKDRSLFYIGAGQEVFGGADNLMFGVTNNYAESSNSRLKNDMGELDDKIGSVFDLAKQLVIDHLNVRIPGLPDYQATIKIGQEEYNEFLKFPRPTPLDSTEDTEDADEENIAEYGRSFLVSKSTGKCWTLSTGAHDHVFQWNWSGMVLLMQYFYLVLLPVGVTAADPDSWKKSTCSCWSRRYKFHCAHTLLICCLGCGIKRISKLAEEANLLVEVYSVVKEKPKNQCQSTLWANVNSAVNETYSIDFSKNMSLAEKDRIVLDILKIKDIDSRKGASRRSTIEMLKEEIFEEFPRLTKKTIDGALYKARMDAQSFDIGIFNKNISFFGICDENMNVGDLQVNVDHHDSPLHDADPVDEEVPPSVEKKQEKAPVLQPHVASLGLSEDFQVLFPARSAELAPCGKPGIDGKIERKNTECKGRTKTGLKRPIDEAARSAELAPCGKPGVGGKIEPKKTECRSRTLTSLKRTEPEFPSQFSDVQALYLIFLETTGIPALKLFVQIALMITSNGKSLNEFCTTLGLPDFFRKEKKVLSCVPLFTGVPVVFTEAAMTITDQGAEKASLSFKKRRGLSCLYFYYELLLEEEVSDMRVNFLRALNIPEQLIPNAWYSVSEPQYPSYSLSESEPYFNPNF
jgi:hypothetical protein